jgi:hypothetical protein
MNRQFRVGQILLTSGGCSYALLSKEVFQAAAKMVGEKTGETPPLVDFSEMPQPYILEELATREHDR